MPWAKKILPPEKNSETLIGPETYSGIE